SAQAEISGDGSFVAFSSTASNLVANDTNGKRDIFRKDTATNETLRVSVDTFSTQANGSSDSPSISDDGDVIAFSSTATNLAPGDTNGFEDVFVRKMTCPGLCFPPTSLVSVAVDGTPGTGFSDAGSVSDDGRYVAFASAAPDLVPNDTNAL